VHDRDQADDWHSEQQNRERQCPNDEKEPGDVGKARNYAGNFDRTPIFIGSSDVDPHVPLARVQESTAVLSRMGAAVDERIYPRMGHTINADELKVADTLIAPGR